MSQIFLATNLLAQTVNCSTEGWCDCAALATDAADALSNSAARWPPQSQGRALELCTAVAIIAARVPLQLVSADASLLRVLTNVAFSLISDAPANSSIGEDASKAVRRISVLIAAGWDVLSAFSRAVSALATRMALVYASLGSCHSPGKQNSSSNLWIESTIETPYEADNAVDYALFLATVTEAAEIYIASAAAAAASPDAGAAQIMMAGGSAWQVCGYPFDFNGLMTFSTIPAPCTLGSNDTYDTSAAYYNKSITLNLELVRAAFTAATGLGVTTVQDSGLTIGWWWYQVAAVPAAVATGLFIVSQSAHRQLVLVPASLSSSGSCTPTARNAWLCVSEESVVDFEAGTSTTVACSWPNDWWVFYDVMPPIQIPVNVAVGVLASEAGLPTVADVRLKAICVHWRVTTNGTGMAPSRAESPLPCGNGGRPTWIICKDNSSLFGGAEAGSVGTCTVGCVCEPGSFAAVQCNRCIAACGDGFVDPDEQCDDGGNDADDGCSAQCSVEAGFVCEPDPAAPPPPPCPSNATVSNNARGRRSACIRAELTTFSAWTDTELPGVATTVTVAFAVGYTLDAGAVLLLRGLAGSVPLNASKSSVAAAAAAAGAADAGTATNSSDSTFFANSSAAGALFNTFIYTNGTDNISSFSDAAEAAAMSNITITSAGRAFEQSGQFSPGGGWLQVKTVLPLAAGDLVSFTFSVLTPTRQQPPRDAVLSCAANCRPEPFRTARLAGALLGISALVPPVCQELGRFGPTCEWMCLGVVSGKLCLCPPGRFGTNCAAVASPDPERSLPGPRRVQAGLGVAQALLGGWGDGVVVPPDAVVGEDAVIMMQVF